MSAAAVPAAPGLLVKAGQVFRAPAPRVHGGFRYVLVLEIRSPKTEDAYANLREITPDGKKAHPSVHHPFRGEVFSVPFAGRPSLPFPYELVPDKEA
jgi:hypothetical protein